MRLAASRRESARIGAHAHLALFAHFPNDPLAGTAFTAAAGSRDDQQ
jgi:hypothetical protein